MFFLRAIAIASPVICVKLVEFLNEETDEEYREIYYEELSLVELKIKIWHH